MQLFNQPIRSVKALLIALLVVFLYFTPGKIHAQTPTPTPYQYVGASAQFYVLDYLYSAHSNWITPAASLGMPDGRTADINAQGFYPLYADFEMTYESGATLSAIKVDVIGSNFDNITVNLTHNNSVISGCGGKDIYGSAYGHHYVTWTISTQCSAFNKAWLLDHTFGVYFKYNTGSYTTTGKIDSVGYFPIFDGTIYTTAVTNGTPLPGIDSKGLPLESCADGDWLCNMRNWFIDTLNLIVGIDTNSILSRYQLLIDKAYTKAPWGYIYSVMNADFSEPPMASPGAIPDFTLPAIRIAYLAGDNKTKLYREFLPETTIYATSYAVLQPAVASTRQSLAVFVAGLFIFTVVGIIIVL
jgi:hypothetical protein